jgi:UDPglucose 6-dehydrogenase
MRNQSRIILGGPRPWINSVKQIFRIAFNDVPIIKTSSTTAEMIKYLTNNFLTVKVAFANEMAQICEALDASGLNIDYDKVVEYASYDERVGKSHWNVPGPDGKRGYGGHCFPKDINAMIDVACKNGVDPKILKAAWQKNLEIRPEKDWESLTGRAVSVSAKSKT